MNNNTVLLVLAGGLALGGALGFGAGTKFTGGSLTTTSATQSDVGTCSIGGAEGAALFELDGKSYTLEELPSDVQSAAFEIQNENYERYSALIKEYGVRLSLAQEKNLASDPKNIPPIPELVEKKEVTDEDAKKFFEENKARLPPGTTFEQLSGQVKQFLSMQGAGDVVRTRMTELENSGKFRYLVQAPASPEVSLDLSRYPSMGQDSAAVTLVEASDYLCPHCQTMHPEVKKIVEDYKGKVKFVQANFALRPDQLSGGLIRGGFCAQKIGNEQFWKYHDAAFELAPGLDGNATGDAEKAEVMKVVEKAALDKAAMEACLGSDEARTWVEATVTELSKAGVSGTPSFFVNNKKVSGGNLKGAIDEALAK